MNLVKDPSKVKTVTTRKGWVYRVIPGTFQEGSVFTGAAEHEDGYVPCVSFEAQGRGFMDRERVSLQTAEVASVVEDISE
ncbi:hypothetical protein [Mycobacterium noviomagense]|uniref:DUF1918 domain-containing protein n=1 Tax=Mycobacterium noviomagense TaxID=459858 RepID=A0A7I7PBV5_9MYCO|nr:hypothetical protein [Mycobacterium noviomagense]ORB11634.1 hypothetical protein BST37_18705 [Mycobacterium noviomagense]BBY06019.1 hypothetical protein MNVI_13370 [Mycobacterium noviomagense]